MIAISPLAVLGFLWGTPAFGALFQDPPPGSGEVPRTLQEPPPPQQQRPGRFTGMFGQEPSFYPMPVIDSAKYQGTNLGLMAAFVFPDAEPGKGTTLLSAVLAYKHGIGINGTVDFRRDPTPDSWIEAYYAQSAKIENEAQLFIEDRQFEDWSHLRAEFHEYRRATDRFFGRSDHSSQQQESALTSNNYQVDARWGPNLTESLGVQATVRWRDYRVGKSIIKQIPQMLDAYPNEPGVEGGTLASTGLAWILDTRDSLAVPRQGEFVTFSAEIAHYFHDDSAPPLWLATGEVTKLWPAGDDGQFITVVHAKTQVAVGGDRVPFWELPSLGGPTTLRSYGVNRFTNAYFILANLEERIRVAQVSLFGMTGDVEVAPFFDVGKVFDSLEDLVGRDFGVGYHYSYGMGFRGVVYPHFVGRLDVGAGPAGVGITVTLDYSF
jgi:hypothetical protein